MSAAPLRIAWLGPDPNQVGGVPGAARLVLGNLLEQGHEVDAYVARLERPLPEEIAAQPAFRLVSGGSRFRYDAWYSRSELSKFLVGQATRAAAMHRLAGELVERHRRRPYDVVYQFSNIEVFGLKRRLRELPPLVVHPGTHIAGELRWFRREQALVRRCEPAARRVAVGAMLRARTARQRHDARLARGFVCPSRVFRHWLVADYGVSEERTRVVPYPVDLERYSPVARNGSGGPLRILFIGRISVRKGVETMVELSHRLADLAGQIEIEVVGGVTLWSNYRALLADLDPRVARVNAGVPSERVPELLARADLLVQPSKYEPFGLTVAEALAAGVPVVATDEVGAVEGVSSECAGVVPVGDVDALEAAVREMLARISGPGEHRVREVARAEAERLFAPAAVSEAIAEALTELTA